jgi:hypothetical protein
MTRTIDPGRSPSTSSSTEDDAMPPGHLIRTLLPKYSLADIETAIRWLEIGEYVHSIGWGAIAPRALLALTPKGVSPRRRDRPRCAPLGFDARQASREGTEDFQCRARSVSHRARGLQEFVASGQARDPLMPGPLVNVSHTAFPSNHVKHQAKEWAPSPPEAFHSALVAGALGAVSGIWIVDLISAAGCGFTPSAVISTRAACP